MGRVIDALVAYRVLKILVTPFNKTQAYKMGIIDDKGKVLIKSKKLSQAFPNSQARAQARKSYTLLIRFVFNLKRLLGKVGIRGPIGSAAAAAVAFFKEENGNNPEIEKLVYKQLKENGFEFSEIRGIKPASTDHFVSEGNIIVLHGAYGNGYVYRQESGNDFDGTLISGKYRSPDLTFNDPGIRKHMQRVVVNYKPEAAIDADLFVRYDYEASSSSRPAAYPLDSGDVVAIYGTATYGVPTYGGASQPLVRQAVEGSGFAVALRVNDGGTTAPYSLKGFQLEYQLGARR